MTVPQLGVAIEVAPEEAVLVSWEVVKNQHFLGVRVPVGRNVEVVERDPAFLAQPDFQAGRLHVTRHLVPTGAGLESYVFLHEADDAAAWFGSSTVCPDRAVSLDPRSLVFLAEL